MFKLESEYQAYLIKKIEKIFPGSFVLNNNANQIQGFPDLTVIHTGGWACLEVKLSKNASKQPNQDYYVEALNKMSYSAFIYPENEEVVLNELQIIFSS